MLARRLFFAIPILLFVFAQTASACSPPRDPKTGKIPDSFDELDDPGNTVFLARTVNRIFRKSTNGRMCADMWFYPLEMLAGARQSTFKLSMCEEAKSLSEFEARFKRSDELMMGASGSVGLVGLREVKDKQRSQLTPGRWRPTNIGCMVLLIRMDSLAANQQKKLVAELRKQLRNAEGP